MEIVLDFEYNEDVVELYSDALENEFTAETRASGTTFTIDQVRNRLHECQKSKQKNGYELEGILKVYVDNKLAAISFPRRVLSSEYDKYSLNPLNNYYRLSGIFVSPDFRGQGISQQIIQWFIDKFKFILWTADSNNYSSIKAAQKAQLNEIKEYDVLKESGEFFYRLKVFSN